MSRTAVRNSAVQNTNKFTYSVGGGFRSRHGTRISRVDPGFNITGGAGYNCAP